ncbi:isoprenylcysteine carboxylmethyltransferase family protein [Qipengyuania sp. 6B39]|uniref:methanethiol S-methyltransferase n=1 Tax=Qipengyuania proteolytica TaxID=2867239 RepID=UPI001C8B06EB|nr:methanethiol S-methyltransferase [Qipengyuania proteolytica]MBX7495649.1 isoprenylcysteine carboxylmethyltransferase family protein [Qipengyuania proteolytica]
MPAIRFGLAVVTYLAFFATFLYLIAFVGGVFVPKTVDSGTAPATAVALVVNLALILLFGLQHSVMARPGFKAVLTRSIHPSIERTAYVFATLVALWILFAYWQPMPRVIWQAEAEWAVMALWALFLIGWTIAFISTWLLNHFELFGLQQTWLHMTGREAVLQKFRQPLFYKVSRHPLYLGMMIGIWAIPTMTLGHLVFAAGMTVYVLIAIRYEERDLITFLGDQYAEYRKRVGMLVPGIGKAK